MSSVFEEIDGWIIDHIFQPIVDWGRNTFGLKKFSFVASTAFVAVLSYMGHVWVEIAKGHIPYVEIFLALFLLWIAPKMIGLAKARDKEGVAPMERFHFGFRMIRLITSMLLISEAIDLLGFRNESTDMLFVGYMLFFWAHLNFLGCKNNPPTFKKSVPRAA